MKTLVLGALLLCAAPAFAGSDVPPAGPAWERDLVAAHAQALEKGLPLFLYFTKTY